MKMNIYNDSHDDKYKGIPLKHHFCLIDNYCECGFKFVNIPIHNEYTVE